MEYITYNNYDVKHTIVVEGHETKMTAHVTRHRTIGGRPLSLTLELDPKATYLETVGKINNLVYLEDEMFTMIHEMQHTTDVEDDQGLE